MEDYKIIKVLSNNVVLVNHRDINHILLGKGIGFNRNKGDIFENLDNIESKFISLEGLSENDSNKLMDDLNPKIIELVNEILEMAKEKLKKELHPRINAGLIDHIQFSIKRLKDNVKIINPFLEETKLLYPMEYEVAKEAVSILSNALELKIPESEIGFLTFHICGGLNEASKMEALENTKILNKIIMYAKEKLNLDINPSSFDYNRFLVHLKGVINRVKTNKSIKNNLLTDIKEKNIIEYKIAYDMSKIIENQIGCKVPDDEVGYIAIHLMKLNN